MVPELRAWTREEMMKRVAFFKDLKGSKGGLPDSDLPECERELINVIGVHLPNDENTVSQSVPSRPAVTIPISEGLNLASPLASQVFRA